MEKSFGDNIRTLRKQLSLTQEELANYLGVSFQTVSKWERNDTLPDILMLPKIASFFDVSTDFLLGVDGKNKETEIQKYLDEYYYLWENGELSPLCQKLKQAVRNYPGDYRLIVRYFNVLTTEAVQSGNPLKAVSEAESMYLSIQKHCTTDSIRIWSQKIMANFYKELSKLDNSTITTENVKQILENMPIMQNSRDFIATYLFDNTERKTACANAVCELMYLLCQVLINLCDTDIPKESKIEALESMLNTLEIFFPSVDYGKLLTSVIQINTLLVKYYHELKLDDKAIFALKRCAEMSKKFDTIDKEESLSYTSPLLQGISVTKQEIPHNNGKSKVECLIEFLKTINSPAWIELI